MRGRLWPETPDHDQEIARFYAGSALEPLAVLIAVDETGRPIGFIELSIRPYAEGCDGNRIAYMEGWYVEPRARRREIGRELVEAAEAWGTANGCSDLASDTEIHNQGAIAAHLGLGFTMTSTVQCFAKPLRASKEVADGG